jgi:antitoxin (DNA-binding transcriptional repressor) of toxin-antitoxin stability system
MKRVTASDARKNWFRLLDEVAAGEVVVIERNGERIVLRREPAARRTRQLPDYSAILHVPDADSADSWSWEWDGPEAEITLRPEDE